MINGMFSTAHSLWPRIGLVLFLLFFAVILWWSLRGGRHRFDAESRLPLDDEADNPAMPSESQRIPS
jgi:cbb3-type cytochrome oxidase subunit 3